MVSRPFLRLLLLSLLFLLIIYSQAFPEIFSGFSPGMGKQEKTSRFFTDSYFLSKFRVIISPLRLREAAPLMRPLTFPFFRSPFFECHDSRLTSILRTKLTVITRQVGEVDDISLKSGKVLACSGTNSARFTKRERRFWTNSSY